ncbi:nucleotide exchange factor GrpE [Spiroplasma endosymbiont of Amphibalanus improvisus]|uniref:nucleotide exchange factor GrpE n=1 Tax=Spiroplasma endosymbiont of Amphibalanus improvisus TaxID=3066327 RepID=UPI00313A907E
MPQKDIKVNKKEDEQLFSKFNNLLNNLNNNPIYLKNIKNSLNQNDFRTAQKSIAEFEEYIQTVNKNLFEGYNKLLNNVQELNLNNNSSKKESKEQKKQLEQEVQTLVSKIEQITKEAKQFREEKKMLVEKCNQLKNQLDHESIDFKNYGSFNLAKELVPILDLFESSLNVKVKNDEVNNFLMGFKMVFNNLKEIFDAQGIKQINIKPGDEFDHEIHEAIEAVDDNSNFKSNQIVEVLKKPYKMKEKILRHGIVKVKK